MPTINELKKKALNDAGYTGSISDAEYKWLKEVCSPYVGSIPDMWRYTLNQAGYTGLLSDAQNKMLSDLGHTGALPNKWYKYWRDTPLQGVGATANQQFDALIAKYSPIYAYNLADAATRWRDTSATLPATTAGTHTLGRLDDKSSNARHVSQATSSSRPTLGNSGDLWWMTGDGTDDWMRSASFTQAQPWWRFSALQQISWANSERIFGPAATGQGYLGQRGSSPNLSLFDGSWAVTNADAALGADAVVYEVHNGASSSITVDAGTAATGNPGTSLTDGLTVFSDPAGGLPGNIRLYATIAGAGTLTAQQAAEIRTVMARLQGRTL